MKFDMGRAWSEVTHLIGANRDVVLIVAGVFFFLPYTGFMMVMSDQLTALQAGAESGNADPEAAMQALMGFYGSIWWVILLVTIIQGIGMLGLLALLTDRSRPTVGAALAIGAKYLLPYLAAQIMVGVLLGAIFLIPFAVGSAVSVAAGVVVGIAAVVAVIYLFTKFSLVPPVMVNERRPNPFAALGRSWRLTKGNSLRLWLFYFLLIVAIVVAGLVVSMVVGLVFALMGPEIAVVGNAIVSGVLNAVWATIFLAALAAAHRQLAGPSTEAVRETFE